jgi:Raf kinase inhibitor-like YbhB/YbcL family protein
VSEFTISSPAFETGGTIPEVFTCMGGNVSPELVWSGVPEGTTSLALVMDDPDAAGFVHWVAWNIPPESTGFPQDVPAGSDFPNGGRQAANDFAEFVTEGELAPGGAPWKIVGYDGPCPGEVHAYVFTLYALTGTIDLPGGIPGADIIASVEAARADGSLIGEVSIAGFYGPA